VNHLLSAGTANHGACFDAVAQIRFLERVRVVAPEFAFLHVGGRKLPVLLRLVETIHEALLLLLARDVKEELQNFRPCRAT
jgi:hypothetical protein